MKSILRLMSILAMFLMLNLAANSQNYAAEQQPANSKSVPMFNKDVNIFAQLAEMMQHLDMPAFKSSITEYVGDMVKFVSNPNANEFKVLVDSNNMMTISVEDNFPLGQMLSLILTDTFTVYKDGKKLITTNYNNGKMNHSDIQRKMENMGAGTYSVSFASKPKISLVFITVK